MSAEELHRVRELIERGALAAALDALEGIRRRVISDLTSADAAGARAATRALTDVLSVTYEIRDLTTDDEVARRAAVLDGVTQQAIAEAKRREETSVGLAPRRTAVPVVIGAVVGAIIGARLGYEAGSPDANCRDFCLDLSAVTAAIFGLLVAVIGAAGGLAIRAIWVAFRIFRSRV